MRAVGVQSRPLTRAPLSWPKRRRSGPFPEKRPGEATTGEMPANCQRRRNADGDSAPARWPRPITRSGAAGPDCSHSQGRRVLAVRFASFGGGAGCIFAPRNLGRRASTTRAYQDRPFLAVECPKRRATRFTGSRLLEADCLIQFPTVGLDQP